MEDLQVRRKFYEEGRRYSWDEKSNYKDICSSFEDFNRRFVYNKMWDNWHLRQKTDVDRQLEEQEQRELDGEPPEEVFVPVVPFNKPPCRKRKGSRGFRKKLMNM